MRRFDRIIASLAIAGGVLAASGCNRLTFIKPDMGKLKVEQVRQPVAARDSAEVRARMAAHQQVAQASAALQAGDLAGAASLAQAVLRADPTSVDAHTLLGAIAQQQGRIEEAGAFFKKAAEMSGGRSAEIGNYAAWLCASGRASEGLALFEHVIAANAAGADMLANAGACAVDAGQGDRAHGLLRQALQLDPVNALALEKLALLSLRRGQPMEARAFIQRRLELQPVTAAALQTAIQAEQQLGDAASAARYRQRLSSEFPAAAGTTDPGN